MIRWLSVAIARFRHRAVVGEIVAVDRQMQQCVEYRAYLLAREAQAAVAVLIAEGGDVTHALQIAVQQEHKREVFQPRQVAR